MAVSRAPKRQAPAPAATSQPDEKVDEKTVLKVIQRGGSVRADKAASHTDDLKNVQLRLYQSEIDQIDAARARQKRRKKPASRHAWILAAIQEKLDK